MFRVGIIFFGGVVCVANYLAAEPKRVMLLHSFGGIFTPWSEYATAIHTELDRQSRWPLDIIENSLVPARISVQQVICNPIVNGMGAVSDASDGQRGIIGRTAQLDGAFAEVSISDFGPGIPSGDLEKVFDPFFTNKTKGLGLGLSIAPSLRLTVDEFGRRTRPLAARCFGLPSLSPKVFTRGKSTSAHMRNV